MFRAYLPALALVLLAASPAAGQLTVVLDQATYTVGETVEITVHNAGPTTADYELEAVVPASEATWSKVKALYR